MKRYTFKYPLSILLGMLILMSCDSDRNPRDSNDNSGEWLIPRDQVFDGGPGKDGIPALTNPELIQAPAATYLNDNDLILGFVNGGDARAYPHKILDWHEIINDDLGNVSVSVIYCPLTGTGIGWDRNLSAGKTTFGVSGLLYNTNVIPYDRKTDTNWSQLALLAVNGQLVGESPTVINLVETTWKTWKEMYPQTRVVSTNTGHNRNYQQFPYGDYKTNNNAIFFPVSRSDNRLPAKERVLAVIADNKTKAYSINLFGENHMLIEDEFAGSDLVIIGNKNKNFIVAFQKRLQNGTPVELSLVDNGGPVILEDASGNRFDVFGNVVQGPKQGQKLQTISQMMGYWFAWAPFYESLDIFEPQN
ncbi:DUF3179 domain-containing protein [Aquiflexum sp.]|uniref:DUF3179 domain-containing protein n=1 Tax=Aquiflexum sp. TaxID=1872584 RepID=UPI0035947510